MSICLLPKPPTLSGSRRFSALRRLSRLRGLLALCAFCGPSLLGPRAQAASRASAAYSVTAEVVDSAGQRGSSATYRNEGDLGSIGSTLSGAGYKVASGFFSATLNLTLPVLSFPSSPVIAEATSANGAIVSFPLSASDNEDGPLTPQVSAPSGSLFALGETTVNVSVTDATANPASGSFTIRVVDTTAPQFTSLSADLQVWATDAQGAVVDYAPATATDNVTADPVITYSQASGTKFPIGLTTVTVAAMDAFHNLRQATFTVQVRPKQIVPTVSTGAPVPDAALENSNLPPGAMWKSFGIPGLDAGVNGVGDGVPVFLATLNIPLGQSAGIMTVTGIFGLGGREALLARTGAFAPNTPDLFASLSEPVGNGGTAFIGKLVVAKGGPTAANAQGLWSNAFTDPDGALHLVARAGFPAPNLDVRYKSIDAIALNDGQNLFWAATLTGPAAGSSALFVQSSLANGPSLVLRSGQALGSGTVKSFLALRDGGNAIPGSKTGFGTGRPNGGATTPVLVTFTNKATAVANVGAGVGDLLAVTQHAAPFPNSLWKTLGIPAAGGSSTAFRAVLAPAPSTTDVTPLNATVLCLKTGTQALAGFARQGGAAPGLGSLTYADFGDPALNATGDVLYFATLSGSGVTASNKVALFVASEGRSELIQRAGTPAPEIPGVLIGAFTGAALPQKLGPNEPLGPVFQAILKSGMTAVTASNNSALFAVGSDGALHKLVRTGDLIGGKALKTIDAFSYVNGSPVQARAATTATHVIYRATFTDLTQAIVQVAVP